MDLGLKGLNAIVTGGTKGIGLAIARTLAAEGANVGICARDAAQVAATVAELEKMGVKAWKPFGRKRAVSNARAPSVVPAQAVGLPSEAVRAKVVKSFNKFRSIKFDGAQGESDRRIPDRMPKWLFSGKRGNGKTDRR